MPDFKTPNLCGASTEFNSLLSTFDSLENDLLNGLETAASTLSSTLGTGLDSLISDFSDFGIPELPTLPNINLQSQLTSLASLDISSVEGLNQYNSLLSDITTQFGDALSTAGFSLDSLVSDATSLISGGDGLCGAIPNFSLPTDGTATQIADAVGQASKKIETELPATITTAKSTISTALATLKADTETAAAAAKTHLSELIQLVPEGSGILDSTVEIACSAKDAIISENCKPDPALKRSINVNKQQKSVDGGTGTSSSVIEQEEFGQAWVREMGDGLDELKLTLKIAERLISKSKKEYPHNLNEDGTKIYVSYPNGGGPISAVPTYSDAIKAKYLPAGSEYQYTWQGYYNWKEAQIFNLNKMFVWIFKYGDAYSRALNQTPPFSKVVGNLSKSDFQSQMTNAKEDYLIRVSEIKTLYEGRITEFKKTFTDDPPVPKNEESSIIGDESVATDKNF